VRAIQPLLSPDIPVDLTNCDLEPIHIPSLIQPHGMLLAARNSDLRIVYTSENSLNILGIDPAFILERTLPELLGAAAVASIEEALGLEKDVAISIRTAPFPLAADTRFDVSAHRTSEFLYVELEIASGKRRWDLVSARLEKAVRQLGDPRTVESLCLAIPPLIRQITGFDRVMVYKFDPDGHGHVVAEEKAAEMEPFLDLHYPATDIPRQARRLFLLQRLRTIVDVGYQAVPVLGNPEITHGEPLDMTYCGLRSVSPIHVEYLANMGVGASLTLSIIQKGELWGMIVCHHRTGRLLAPETRKLCDLLARHISLLIDVAQQLDESTERLAKMAMLDILNAAVADEQSVELALATVGDTTLALTGADGAMVRIGEHTQWIGKTPEHAAASGLLSALLEDSKRSAFHTDHVGETYPAYAQLASTASGVFLIPLKDPQDGILWFRGEVAQTVRWAGKPDASKQYFEGSFRLSPRKSFEAWEQIQSGRSLPWRASEIEAALVLKRFVLKVLLRRAEDTLQRLTNFDYLTGLATRQALVTELAAWQNSGTQAAASLLFLDLDDFKTINERYGYEKGDELLKAVGRHLASLADSRYFVARLGGDEFVIFCKNTDFVEAETLAKSILRTLPALAIEGDREVRTSSSIGVAPVKGLTNTDIADPLRAADSAMYVAKHKGGNQVSIVESRQQAQTLRLAIQEAGLKRQRAATELADTYAHLKSIMDSTSEGILEVGYDWVIRYGNQKAMESFVDYEVGRSFWECFPAVGASSVEEHLRRAMASRSEVAYEHYYAPHDVWFKVNAFPMDGGISIFFSDISAAKKLESRLSVEQLLREKRIEALSHMAGGLAHEISNPLAIIHALASDLQSLAMPGLPLSAREVKAACDSIVVTSDRAMRILRGLRGFAREGRKDPMEWASIADIVDQCLEMQLSRFERHSIDLQVSIGASVPQLFCREIQISQIVTNLLNNAFDSINQAESAERWVSLTVESSESETHMDVTDSGPGIEDHFKTHLMEPFFTTKELGLGMGVGLSLSRAIAEDHGGTLTLRQGTEHTCFRLLLPLVMAAEAPAL
jgi:diguanylate cyclase (GGDEF)-like protein